MAQATAAKPPRKQPGKLKSRARLGWALALAVICIVAYEPWRVENSSGDTISSRYWPIVFLKEHTWRMDSLLGDMQGVGYAGIFSTDGKRLTPRNGWGMIAFSLPVYAVADVLHLGGDDWSHDRVREVSKYNAVLLTTLSVVALFFLLSRFASPLVAFSSSVLFALGTWSWSMAPQGLYSQTVTLFLHMLNLLVLWNLCAGPRTKGRDFNREGLLLGLIHALIWSVRPQDLPLVFPAVLLLRERKALLPYLCIGSAIVVPIMLGYKSVYGFYSGAYGVIEALGVETFRLNPFGGALGLLFSPNRGAIVFFPLLLILPYLWKVLLPKVRVFTFEHDWSQGRVPSEFARACAQGAVLYGVMLSFLIFWHSGWAYGSRYLFELAPYLWVPITLMVEDVMKRVPALHPRLELEGMGATKPVLPLPATILCGVMAIQSIFIHGLGHSNYDLYVWNFHFGNALEEHAWDLNPWIITETWEKGSNRHRWDSMSAYQRLKTYGF